MKNINDINATSRVNSVQMQRKSEEDARRTLASLCSSKTVLDEDVSSHNEFYGKYVVAVKKERDKFYVSPQEYGWLLKHHREKAGISIKTLSAKLHISVDALEQFESGRTIPEGGNKRRIEKELGVPKEMTLYIVDEAHNYLYGFRNYAPVVYDVCSAGDENAETTLQGLRLLKRVALLVLAAAVFAILCGFAVSVRNASAAKYFAMGCAGVSVGACLFLLFVLRVAIRHQTQVKIAFQEVVASLWGEE